MCITAGLAIATVAISAVGTAKSMQSAQAQATNERYALKISTKQANEARDIAELQALQQENERTGAFQQARSAALAAIGASGLGEHISFFQGLDEANQHAWLNDVRSTRLNLVQTKSSVADQVAVNGYGSVMAGFNAKSRSIGAMVDFAKTAMSAANFYATNRAPSGG